MVSFFMSECILYDLFDDWFELESFLPYDEGHRVGVLPINVCGSFHLRHFDSKK